MTTRVTHGGLQWRVTGHAMTDRFTVRLFSEQGRVVSIDKSEVITAGLLSYAGWVLLPGPPETSATLLGAMTALLPPMAWGMLALLIGLPQLLWTALVWTGFCQPSQALRLALLFATTCWWAMLAPAVLANGLYVGAGVDLAFAMMAAVNMRRVWAGTP